MKNEKTKIFALLTAGLLAISPVVTMFSNTATSTVLAAKKPKKVKKHKPFRFTLAAGPIWEKNKKYYYNDDYKCPMKTVHIYMSKSNPFYEKAIETVNAWNATGCCTLKLIMTGIIIPAVSLT